MIRLAVRCSAGDAERVLAELIALAPDGVEERRGEGYVEYAIYGAPGELPALPELQATAGDGLVEVTSEQVPDDWGDRWREFHRPVSVGDRLRVRPPWVPAADEAEIDVIIDPGRAFGTGSHPTTRMCLEVLLGLDDAGESGGSLVDLGTGSGVLAIAAAKLGWHPVIGVDHDPVAIETAASNARANGVEIEMRRLDLREASPPPAETMIANLTLPLLLEVAARLDRDRLPARLICSGLLRAEAGRAAAALSAKGLVERERRGEDDWMALLVARE